MLRHKKKQHSFRHTQRLVATRHLSERCVVRFAKVAFTSKSEERVECVHTIIHRRVK